MIFSQIDQSDRIFLIFLSLGQYEKRWTKFFFHKTHSQLNRVSGNEMEKENDTKNKSAHRLKWNRMESNGMECIQLTLSYIVFTAVRHSYFRINASHTNTYARTMSIKNSRCASDIYDINSVIKYSRAWFLPRSSLHACVCKSHSVYVFKFCPHSSWPSKRRLTPCTRCVRLCVCTLIDLYLRFIIFFHPLNMVPSNVHFALAFDHSVFIFPFFYIFSLAHSLHSFLFSRSFQM